MSPEIRKRTAAAQAELNVPTGTVESAAAIRRGAGAPRVRSVSWRATLALCAFALGGIVVYMTPSVSAGG